MKQRITPHLWFDTSARQAAECYTALFPGSEIISATMLHDTPGGDAETVSFTIGGYHFMSISAGPLFQANPSISFMLNIADAEALRGAWGLLADGGEALMPLQAYPFSPLYGWVQDRFGISWQLMLGDRGPLVVPSLLFTGDVCGRAEEASDFYMSVLGGRRGTLSRYGEGQPSEDPNHVNYTDFTLAGQRFAAMDSGQAHRFGFNEAVSLMVRCDDQAEIDRVWEQLSAVPEAEQCGWLKDRYGVSWQVVPAQLDEMMATGTPAQIDRVTQAFLPMKKFDVAVLEAAFRG